MKRSKRIAILRVLPIFLMTLLSLAQPTQLGAQEFIPRTEPTGDIVNLSVPMLRQVWDTADDFNGNCACGPTSAVMALAYFQKIHSVPMTVNAGGSHTTNYGFHVSNSYRAANGATFSTTRATCSTWNGSSWNVTGLHHAGAWGSTTNGGQAIAYKMQAYLQGHGLEVEFSDRSTTTVDQDKTGLRQALNQGYPVIASVRMRGLYHIVVVRGYTDDDRFILNDPYGNPADSNYTVGGSHGGENIRIRFPGDRWTYISWWIVVKGQRGLPNVPIDTDDNRRFGGGGQSMNGTLNPNNDDDIYWFSGNSGSLVKLNMNANGGNLDTYLELYQPGGRLLAYNDDANGSLNSEIRVNLPFNGDYKVVAHSYRRLSGGSYTLSLNPLMAGEGDDGRWLQRTGATEGTITPRTDRDTYYFNGSSGTIISLRMNRIDGDLDSFLELYNQYGQLIARNDDGGGNLNSWIAYRLSSNGRYAVVARSWNLASSGRYSLSLRSDRLNALTGLAPDASSALDPAIDPALATDGDIDTSWISGEDASQRLIVDLGQQRTINQAIVRWSSDNYAAGYGLYYRDAAEQWQPLFATESGDGDVDVLTFPAIGTRYLLLEMWARPEYSERYAISEFEASNTEDVLIPLIPPDDPDKPVETDVPSLAPLAPEPEGKEPPLFALGADQESFPLSDADGPAHAPDVGVATLSGFPVAEISLSRAALLPDESLTATAVNAHDQDSGQIGAGIDAYRWTLLPVQMGANGGVAFSVGDQAEVTITNGEKLEPGVYLLQLEVQDDEGSWSTPISQQITLGGNVYLPLVTVQ